MKSSRVLRALRRRDRASAPAAASPTFLTSPGRCEACPSVPPDTRSTAPVTITSAPQRCWDAQGPATSSVNQSLSATLAYRNLRECRAAERTDQPWLRKSLPSNEQPGQSGASSSNDRVALTDVVEQSTLLLYRHSSGSDRTVSAHRPGLDRSHHFVEMSRPGNNRMELTRFAPAITAALATHPGVRALQACRRACWERLGLRAAIASRTNAAVR